MRLFAPAADTWGTRPLIGVTTSEMRRGDLSTLRRHGEPPQPEMALGMTYLAAIERSGGLPVVLPPLPAEAVAPLLDRLDGVCLSGGPDLDPDAYGARERHGELGPTEPHLDQFELELARAADARGLPLLGVCRGAQALNVARGGTLHQHIDGHRQVELATVPTHAVTLALHSQAARIAGCTRFEVNSFHHQAVDRLGDGLRIAGCAQDGTVEAIEDPSRPFVVGVQWHAETLVDRPVHLNLFMALVRAAAGSSRVLRAA
jgi:putative glutamine amidotransferase